MNHPIKKIAASLLVGLAGFLPATASFSQSTDSFPSKPVRLLVSFPPGGFADLVGRALAQSLAQTWGQPVIVDNRPGGAGILASELAAKAVPDGYTLYLATDGPFVINPSLYKTLPYRPVKDFVPVALVAYTPLALVVNPDKVHASTVSEFVAVARANAKKPLDYSSGGAGGPHHLSMEAFRLTAGIPLNHIPYKGGAPALQDVLSGQVSAMFSAISSALPYAKAGKLRIIATGGTQRSALAPDVPTFAESGYPGFEAGAWAGVVVPRGTPASIVSKIEADVMKTVRDPKFGQRLTAVGAEPFPRNAAEFQAKIRKDQQRYGKLIADLHIVAD
ncbi:Bug family tripartite tricarboxylate transporter substrate binding protein [Cupriavidus necator]|uniref:Bug family tripartite tricarboxylate transporter substrate binding protein n=1 Tax=Cupriavidus necator TaxID=106590 RepID=UPI0005B504CE|nr:tripartite tricarboxylate transporter substrate binding protein [Cupriavidus necator]